MSGDPLWYDALAAARIAATGGAALAIRARAGPVRERLLEVIATASPAGVIRITADSDPASLVAGTDLLASVAAGEIMRRAGLAERVGEALLLVSGAERLPAVTAGLLADAIDRGALSRLVLLDEGIDDEGVAPMLADRVAMRIDLGTLSIRDLGEPDPAPSAGAHIEDPIGALSEACPALGIASLRVPLHAIAVARAAATIAGRTDPADADLALAARLVLAPRARVLPDQAEPPEEGTEAPSEDPSIGDADRERIVDAVRTALPDGLIDRDAASALGRGQGGSALAKRGQGVRGRSGRVRRGLPQRGARLDLAATLIAAAPFQRMRGRVAGGRPAIEADDIRIRRPLPVRRAVTIFAVDASGSAASARLAEVKGAVEHLLAQSYVRRDEVALVAFRGEGAETLLPPTRSLARARRELAGLPGGGGTPLAAGVIAGLEQAIRSRAGGRAPLLLVLTDGGANIARDGTRGRAAARDDAEAAGRLVAGAGIASVVVDSSPRGQPDVRALAAAMAARYVALPRLDGVALGAIVAGSQTR